MRARRALSLPKPSLRPLAPIAALILLAAGCTIEGPTETPSTAASPEPPSPAVESAPATLPSIGFGASFAPGRIAVLDDLGKLIAFDPDGTDVVVLAEPVQGETLVRQPTWSPDGDRIAWVRFAVGTEATNAIVTMTPDGSEPTETPTEAIPFYLSWDPTSSRIAYLGSSSVNDIELGIAEVSTGEGAAALDAGSPFYFSWGPSGEQLLVHVGGERLDRLELDGTTVPVGDRPGSFDTPVWTSDGGSLVYASEAGVRQRLVAHDVAAGRARALVRFDGAITFVVSPDGRRVAYQIARGPNDVGPLVVLDRRTGAVEQVVDAIVPAYFWSPKGSELLYLLPEQVGDRFWFRWGVWKGGSSFTTPRFYPSETFARDYLEFFQQYAQSMSLWAPDGSAFTYAGSNEAGASGVWIQPATEGAEPVLVADGVFAEWSPA